MGEVFNQPIIVADLPFKHRLMLMKIVDLTNTDFARPSPTAEERLNG